MASERDLEAILQQILQIQVDAGLEPGTSLSETLDRLLHPILQLDGPTPDQPPSHTPQQTLVILILGHVDASTAHVVQQIMSSLSQNRSASVQPSPPSQSAPFTMPGVANQVPAPPPSNIPASSLSQVIQLDVPRDASPRCPVCEQSFGRPQERDRHVLTHLPYWLFCPILGCPWRSDRSYTLRTHWIERHADFGEAPNPEDYKIYNPEPLVQLVVGGGLLIEEATEIALQAVRTRAQELERVGVWEDEWGRGQRVRH